jgi:hypothetical protein
MPAGRAAAVVAFTGDEEEEAESLGVGAEVVLPVGELARLLPEVGFTAVTGKFEAVAVEAEGTEGAPEISILTWKLPLAVSPDGPLMPRNNRPVTRTGN